MNLQKIARENNYKIKEKKKKSQIWIMQIIEAH